MPRVPGRCRTCRKCDSDVGNYCADCTLNYLVDRWGWNQQWWFTTTRTGGTRGGKPHSRADKRKLLKQALRVYDVTYGEEGAREGFRDAVRSILLKSPTYRSFGTTKLKHDTRKSHQYKNFNYAIRMIVFLTERRIREGRNGIWDVAKSNRRNDSNQ